MHIPTLPKGSTRREDILATADRTPFVWWSLCRHMPVGDTIDEIEAVP